MSGHGAFGQGAPSKAGEDERLEEQRIQRSSAFGEQRDPLAAKLGPTESGGGVSGKGTVGGETHAAGTLAQQPEAQQSHIAGPFGIDIFQVPSGYNEHASEPTSEGIAEAKEGDAGPDSFRGLDEQAKKKLQEEQAKAREGHAAFHPRWPQTLEAAAKQEGGEHEHAMRGVPVGSADIPHPSHGIGISADSESDPAAALAMGVPPPGAGLSNLKK